MLYVTTECANITEWGREDAPLKPLSFSHQITEALAWLQQTEHTVAGVGEVSDD